MSGGSAPPPPETFKIPHQTEAAQGAYDAIGGLQSMPNQPAQTANQATGALSPIIGANSGYNPATTVGYGNSISELSSQYLPYAKTIFDEGFDPQGAVYGRAAHNLTEQVRASEGARGIQTSPYGAGLENEALGNFNLDWENNRLGRMATAAGAALPFYGQAGNQMAQGQQVAQSGPGMQGNLAALLSPVQQGAYAQPQMVIGDWLNYTGAGTAADQVTAQNYATQIAKYKADQEANAAMYNAIGSTVGAIGGGWAGGGFA